MTWKRPPADGSVRTGIREALDNQGNETGRLTRGHRYDFHAAGSGSLVLIDNGGERYLKHLAKTLPDEFNRSLRSLGFHLQRRIKQGVLRGRIGGSEIRRAETSARFRRMAQFRAGGSRAVVPQRRTAKGVVRGGWRKTLSKGKRAYGKVAQAVGYLHEPDKQQVQIGWLGLSARSFGTSLAKGSRGRKYQWQSGPQVITARMRRYFAATGRALPAGLTHLESPQRPVIGPAFDEFRPELGNFMEKRISGYLRKKK